MIQFIMNLPLWQLIRSLGMVSYILLTAGIALGIIYSFPHWSANTKSDLYEMHTFITNTAMILGLLHGIITVIDPYMPFSWGEVLIPFTAKNAPILNGLGTLAAFGLIIVIFTSDIRHKISKKAWHLFHLFSYPVFVMTFIHGYFLGTDTDHFRWMYLFSLILIMLLTTIRIMVHGVAPSQDSSARS